MPLPLTLPLHPPLLEIAQTHLAKLIGTPGELGMLRGPQWAPKAPANPWGPADLGQAREDPPTVKTMNNSATTTDAFSHIGSPGLSSVPSGRGRNVQQKCLFRKQPSDV